MIRPDLIIFDCDGVLVVPASSIRNSSSPALSTPSPAARATRPCHGAERLRGQDLANGQLPALFKKWIGTDLAELPATGEGTSALRSRLRHPEDMR
jgi:phosphoglycolate phosphatase-like HAD superfamily hydrolase